VSVSGSGVALPVAAGEPVIYGQPLVTVTASEVRVASLPRARLDANGVHVVPAAGPPYPGDLATDVAAAIAHTGDQGVPVVLAPRAMPASRIVDVIAATPAIAAWWLGVSPPGSVDDWQMPATIPLILAARGERAPQAVLELDGPTLPDASVTGDVGLDVGDRAAVQDLAALLVKLHASGVTRIELRRLTRRVSP
jgi:hypothetical protein